MDTLNLQVLNVKCDGCVSNIKSGLETFENIELVVVEKENGKVTIQGTNLDQLIITKKLQDLGYPENTH